MPLQTPAEVLSILEDDEQHVPIPAIVAELRRLDPSNPVLQFFDNAHPSGGVDASDPQALSKILPDGLDCESIARRLYQCSRRFLKKEIHRALKRLGNRSDTAARRLAAPGARR